MIENMIKEANSYMQLTIEEAIWDATIFHIYGKSWSFVTLSAWRLSTLSKVICGCYVPDSDNEICNGLNIRCSLSIIRVVPFYRSLRPHVYNKAGDSLDRTLRIVERTAEGSHIPFGGQ